VKHYIFLRVVKPFSALWAINIDMVFLCVLQYNEIYKEVEGVAVCDKLVLDFDLETKEELVAVDPYIVSKLKPHQVN